MPAKQTNQPVQRTIVGPLSLHPYCEETDCQAEIWPPKPDIEPNWLNWTEPGEHIGPSTAGMRCTFICRPFSKSSCDGGVSTAL